MRGSNLSFLPKVWPIVARMAGHAWYTAPVTDE